MTLCSHDKQMVISDYFVHLQASGQDFGFLALRIGIKAPPKDFVCGREQTAAYPNKLNLIMFDVIKNCC